MADPRQLVPGTDRVLADPEVAAATARLGHQLVKHAVHAAQERARNGEIEPARVVAETLAALPDSASSIRPVLNATGVLLHTNLGRAPLSDAAIHALREAAGTTNVELDLHTGRRGPRGAAAIAALLAAVPGAEAAHVVNNGAAALSLAATALAQGREIVLARGEMVEIGDGFRIPELLSATGARLREVGTTNRVRLDDYRQALNTNTGFVLKVHPSNFVISGFTASVPVSALRDLGVPVVVDIGSGLLHPHPVLPQEPDATTTLADGADLVIASGDKLLGGPQAGLLLGGRELVHRLRRHPLARAMRVDKLTLAALEATVRGPSTPTARQLQQDQADLLRRAERLADALNAVGIPASAQCSEATVGGGGAPGIALRSAAVALPERFAKLLREGRPPVLARTERDRCLLDLAALAPEHDDDLRHAVLAVD
ncbi:L-seryl-tRNA(Sec) selenium transferase [Saccharopolyspora phatthalungensis]|uniref:L-seryl-tRNA(Sec) selenium transferase n=1 Tax=Saccharopolyspora phatthalungensis TaxID=664693 RepID=A0A840QCA0_9PSEU|nr:L-seryl-tRNA(Sec) selenium transferase [Saccharopolyspora phatthalungensis]MBB5158364.1 L-seryl-tRNA(Ser) seleniumtransferase [Saccharopolyspora phatthalungensis]